MFIIMVTMCEMLRHVNKEPLKVHTLMKKKTKPAKMKVITTTQNKNCCWYKKSSSGWK